MRYRYVIDSSTVIQNIDCEFQISNVLSPVMILILFKPKILYFMNAVDNLSEDGDSIDFCWKLIVLSTILSGAPNIVNTFHSFFWLYIERNSNMAVQV